VDLVIGAHDHVKLTEPTVVKRPGGTTAWIVETGSFGRYLGRVDLTIEPRGSRYLGSQPRVNLLRYGLTQMDASIPEDLGVLAHVTTLETQLEALYRQPIFHDHVADVEEDLTREGNEPLMGDLAVDAYRDATSAEVAFDVIQFIYGELHPGAIRTVDLLNSIPAIYNPETGKSWTVQTLPMSGRAIRNLFEVFYSTKIAANKLGIVTSGLQMIYSPVIKPEPEIELPSALTELLLSRFAPIEDFESEIGGIVRDIKIGGQPLDPDKKYLAAFGGGILEAFRFLDSTGVQIVPLDGLRDTGTESWRVLMNYVTKHSPVPPGFVEPGNRARTLTPDLAVEANDVQAHIKRVNSAGELEVHVDVTVRNFGATEAPAGALLEVETAAEGINTAVKPTLISLASPQSLPSVQPGGSVTVPFDLVIAGGERGIYRLDAKVVHNDGDVISKNDKVTVWLQAK
jgi:hypothetical protein